jgi:UDP-N-acetylmuramoyl-L-alanyl-D-glutamate--2,6-diaminopimelate ligase
MGRAAAELADRVVVTDEDPREEDGREIIEQITAGARAGGMREGEQLFAIADRTEAIRFAVDSAQPGDTVLLAGKGHESSMLMRHGAVPWDERRVAETAIRQRLAREGAGS